MKYNIMEIKSDGKKWKIDFSTLPEERVENSEKISASGYYYYEHTKTKEEAFRKLQRKMVLAHEEKIMELQESLRKLRILTLTGENYENR